MRGTRGNNWSILARTRSRSRICPGCNGKVLSKSAWSTRIAEGQNTLYTHAIQGFQGKSGVMPPKGGNTTLPDADVKAAVDYMVSAAK